MAENNTPDFISIPDVGGAVEPHAVESGEYKLRVTGWLGGLTKDNKPYIMAKLGVVEPKVVGARGLTYYMALPHAEMDEDQANNALRKIKKFCEAFGLAVPAKINTKEDVGMEAWALVEQKADSSDYADENGFTNNVKRFVR
jgi:hypothetical protein